MNFQKKMLESRPEDALVKHVKLVKLYRLWRLETVEKKVSHSVCDNLKARGASASKIMTGITVYICGYMRISRYRPSLFSTLPPPHYGKIRLNMDFVY